MPYTKSPRPYKHEYDMQQARGVLPDRMARQRARREMDKKGVKRAGKVIDHITPLSKGGTNKDGYTIQSVRRNRSFKRTSSGAMKT